jgi:hypothetical protein
MHKVRKAQKAARTERRHPSPSSHAARLVGRAKAFKAPTPPDHNTVSVGMRAFFSIMEKWGLSPEEERTLLGLPGRSTYYNWKRGDVGEVVHGMDLATRISHVLGIFKGLETIYEEAELADRWVRRPNDAFNGQSALDRMLAGQVTDLADVRYYIDSVIS